MLKTYIISGEFMAELIAVLNANWFISFENGERNNEPVIEITHKLETLVKQQNTDGST